MSMYPQFEKCIFCRTKTIWDEYKKEHETGGFEITLGISILAMLMSRITGMNEEYGEGAFDKYNIIANIIRNNSDVKYKNDDGKTYTDEKFVGFFRDALAHIHIEIGDKGGKAHPITIKSRKKEERKEGKAYYQYTFEDKKFCQLIDELLRALIQIPADYRHCENCENKEQIETCQP